MGEKVDECEMVEEGWTGPRDRRDLAKWGSEASRLIAIGVLLVECIQ